MQRFSVVFVVVKITTISFAATLLAQSALAETSVGSVYVNILDTLIIEETSTVDFGSIPGDNGSCTMGGDGNLSAANGAKCQGSGQVGQFSISGGAGQSVQVSVGSGSGATGLAFQPQLLSSSAPTLDAGNTVALIGGQLDLVDAAPGAQSLTYYITVNYN